MGTIDELTRLDCEIEEAERRAMRDLAEHLRGAVRDMPSESRLARSFVRHAAKLDRQAGASGSSAWRSIKLESLRSDIEHGNSEDVLADLSEILFAAAERLYPGEWRRLIEQFASALERN